MKKLLNVGGGSREIPLPYIYDGWEPVLLDIDVRCCPDVVCDARDLTQLPASEYDAILCSHNLEHYYRHDAIRVLTGFLHVLKPDGFAHIQVPDLGELMRSVVQQGMDIDDVLYPSTAGMITVQDVIYGYGPEIERTGVDAFAHKTGFTPKSLYAMLTECGFPIVYIGSAPLEVIAFAFKNTPTEFAANLLKLPAS